MSVNFESGDVLEVKMCFAAGSLVDAIFNVFHFQVRNITVSATGLPPAVSIPFASVATDVVDDIFTSFAQAWKKGFSSGIGATNATIQSIYPADRSQMYTYTPMAPVVGENIGDQIPMQDAITILKKTGIGQRWGLGRNFYSGIAESLQSDGIIDDGMVVKLADLLLWTKTLQTFNTGVYEGTLAPVLFARLSPGGVRITPVVTSELSNKVIKTQRRRRPGKGI